MKRVGIILIDGCEVIIRVYEISNSDKNKLLLSESRDMTSFKQGKLLNKASDIIEVIAETSFTGYSLGITDWKISSRHVSESVVKDVTLATGMTIEDLLLAREQELICKGLLAEF